MSDLIILYILGFFVAGLILSVATKNIHDNPKIRKVFKWCYISTAFIILAGIVTMLLMPPAPGIFGGFAPLIAGLLVMSLAPGWLITVAIVHHIKLEAEKKREK